MAGIGGGKQSSNQSSVQLGTGADPNQLPFLKDLWTRASSFMGSGQGGTDQAQQQLQGYLGQLSGFSQPGVDPRLAMYSQQVGQNFQENIMPQISGQAQMAGGLGNSRQQLAQGVAAGQAGREIANMGTQLYGENQNRALQALGMQTGISQQMPGLAWSPLQQYAGILGPMVSQNKGGSSIGSSSGWNANVNVGSKG